MFRKKLASGIGYDKEFQRMIISYYIRKGYISYAIKMSKEEFDKIYKSDKWQEYKMKHKAKRQVKNCRHEYEKEWEEGQKIGRLYCKHCAYTEFRDERTKEEKDAIWERARKEEEKQRLTEEEEHLKKALIRLEEDKKKYEEKYNEKL